MFMAHDDLTTFIAEHADPLLAELVPLAGAATRAALDNPVLYRAREADCLELLAGLCPHKLAALAIVAASELALVGWTPQGVTS
jgi:hypothetical protein